MSATVSDLNKDEILQWLYGLGVHGIKLGLRNITELLHRLGDPQRSFRTVHVAGTDGKGSTCAMIHSILDTAGIKTGLYTSPHLVDFNERISVSGVQITDSELSKLAERLMGAVEDMAKSGMLCTFFEVTTAIAFMHFRNKGAEYAVIEVGMGGRFDATNVIVPEVSVITNISLEHTEYLGGTVDKIAFEKAGIIKDGVPVVTMNRGVALDVIRNIAEAKGSELIVTEDPRITGMSADSVTMVYRDCNYVIGIPGEFQAQNAAMAVDAVGFLSCRDRIEGHIVDGLKNVRWPGRMQKIAGMPIIIDVSHTAAGAKVLAENIKELYGTVTVVFGVLSDKDIDGISRSLASIASKMVLTEPGSERAMPMDRVKSVMCRYMDDVRCASDVGSAIEEALKIRDDGMVLVTGSLFMAGDALKWLRKTSV